MALTALGAEFEFLHASNIELQCLLLATSFSLTTRSSNWWDEDGDWMTNYENLR